MRRDEATAVCERTTHFEGTERELPETVRGVLDNALSNPAMKRHLGLSSSRAIRDMADFQRLPFMTKDFLRRSDPFELCCAEPREVVRVHSTSGTTGEAVIIPYTAADVRVFEMIVARSLMMAGVKPGDRVLVTPGFGLWTAGSGFQGGVEAVGACAIPTGPLPVEALLPFIERLQPNVLIGTASSALLLGETLASAGKPSPFSTAVLGAEQWGEKRRRTIESLLSADTYDIYGMTETYGPGLAIECGRREGLHYWDDLFFIEIVDPETGEPLPDGEIGEVVVTTLHKEALPLVRYRTRDLASIVPGRCSCGSGFPMLSRIRGRADDMIAYRGVNLFPSAVERLLADIDGLGSEFRLLLETENGRDELTVEVELLEGISKEGRAEQLRHRMKTRLSATPRVNLLPEGALPRTLKKSVRVIDNRTNR